MLLADFVRKLHAWDEQSPFKTTATLQARYLCLFKRLQLVRAARTGNRKMRAVQRKQLEPAIHRVVVSEAQHFLLLAEGFVPFKYHPRRVGLEQRLVQPNGASDRRCVVFQV